MQGYWLWAAGMFLLIHAGSRGGPGIGIAGMFLMIAGLAGCVH